MGETGMNSGLIECLWGFNGLHLWLVVTPLMAAAYWLDWKSRPKK
jgi:hypothetical protein